MTTIDNGEIGGAEARALVMALLVNLANRACWAKRHLRSAPRVYSGISGAEFIAQLRGAEAEAWNSLQAAKAIVRDRDRVEWMS